MAQRTVDDRTRELQEQTSSLVRQLVADPKEDIRKERLTATFEVHEMTKSLYTSEELERKAKIDAIARESRALDKQDRCFMDREELYQLSLKAVPALRSLTIKHGLSRREAGDLHSKLRLPSGMDLHFGMFLPTILGQGTDEQMAQFAPDAVNFNIVGTYAQTELGHGTYLRGLETTATYDARTEEFIIHSPTLTATKWWPGGLGRTATHAIIMARLFVGGQDRGPHAFVSQIRSLDDHRPLPGIKIGDIGPTFGFQAVDNGFMRFDHFRVPRNAMLMKNAKVTPGGIYSRPAVAKSSYGTMVFVRAHIVASASRFLAIATTIAVRYNSVRRQTATSPGALETKILDYQNQQFLLLPLVAAAYALHFTGRQMLSMYDEFQSQSDKGDFGVLPELHATSAGLKAFCSWTTANGIETLRRACGGHGYSQYSGLPTLYQDYVANVTYEGENNVMCLQTARYLLKALRASNSGTKLVGQISYLSKSKNPLLKWNATRVADLRDPNLLIEVAQHRAAFLLGLAEGNISKLTAQGQTDIVARNNCSTDLIKAAKAHCFLVILERFTQSIDGVQDPKSKEIMSMLRDLFALHHMEEHLGEFTMDGFVQPRQASLICEQVRSLLTLVRPNAVALVDAFAIKDEDLNSALGRYDGDVYQALYDMAQRDPANAHQVTGQYESLLKPLLSSKL